MSGTYASSLRGADFLHNLTGYEAFRWIRHALFGVFPRNAAEIQSGPEVTGDAQRLISPPHYSKARHIARLTSSLRNKKGPRLAPGALAHTAGCSLPADLEAGSTTRAAVISTVTVGDQLDPECILVLVVRGGAGLTERIQAVLRRTRGCGGESRQLKDHPRAGIQFRQGEGHGRPFGGHLDLGTGSYVGARYVVLLAIAAENDWRLSSCTGAASTASTGGRTTTTRSSAVATTATRGASTGRTSGCATTA